jgi:N6-adenosine-specific RNA methylase IME4
MSVPEICALGSRLPIAENAVLFLWATAPKLAEALKVMEAWRFRYKTNMVWDKQIIGMGYWARGRHEHILIGVRGKFSPPATEHRRASIFEEKRRRHSQKPICVYEWLERAFPEARKLELFARERRPGWAVWGNEVVGDLALLEETD